MFRAKKYVKTGQGVGVDSQGRPFVYDILDPVPPSGYAHAGPLPGGVQRYEVAGYTTYTTEEGRQMLAEVQVPVF